jgi:probable HAF family extracellular repeat protein
MMNDSATLRTTTPTNLGRIARHLRPRLILSVLACLSAACSGDSPSAPDAPAAITVTKGDRQTGAVAAALSDTIVVRVLTQRGAVAAGVPVKFTITPGSGLVSSVVAATDAQGLARTVWTLGTTAGTQTVTAAIDAGQVLISSTATPGPAVSVTIRADSGLTGLLPGFSRAVAVDLGLSRTLAASAADAYGNAVADIWWTLHSASPGASPVAAITSAGTISAIGTDTGVVVASAGGARDSVALGVYAPLQLTSPSPNDTTVTAALAPGEIYPLFFPGRYSNGAGAVTWSWILDGGTQTNGFLAANLTGDLQDVENSTHLPGMTVGTHTFTLLATDRAGAVASVSRHITVASPQRTYTVSFLGGLGGADSFAADISPAGDIVGGATTPAGVTHAVAWRGGRITDLYAQSTVTSSAVKINAGGDILVRVDSEPTCNRTYASVLLRGTSAQTFCRHFAADMNDRGTIAFSDGIVFNGAFVSTYDVSYSSQYPGTPRLLNNLDRVLIDVSTGGSGGGQRRVDIVVAPPYSASNVIQITGNSALAFNDRGDMAGICIQGSQTGRRCQSWLQVGTRVSVYDFIGGTLTAINSHGVAAGVHGTIGAPSGAILINGWQVYRVVLNDPAWTVDEVTRIDDGGRIVGHAVNTVSGQKGAVLLTPASGA